MGVRIPRNPRMNGISLSQSLLKRISMSRTLLAVIPICEVQYEIATYAFGLPTFTIPYEKIKPYLNEIGMALLGLLSKHIK